MTHIESEFFKAVFIAALFTTGWGILRLLFTSSNPYQLRLSLCAFLGLILYPQAFLYARIAFPGLAEKMLPFQAAVIWFYGPFLLVFAHKLLHMPITLRLWLLYFGPGGLFVTIQIMAQISHNTLPGWWGILSLVQAVIFLLVSIGWGLRRWQRVRIVVSKYLATRYFWLLLLVLGLLSLLLLDLYIHWGFFRGTPPEPTVLYALAASCSVYAVVVALTLVSTITRTEQRCDDEQEASGRRLPETSLQDTGPTSDPNTVSRRVELTDHAAKELSEALRAIVATKAVYTRNELSLGDLASLLGVSVHLTSELLNHHMHTSFYEFLNQYRVQEAARLLRDPELKLSVAEIAYEAGFNNPNSFYRTFKSRFNTTPAQYRRNPSDTASDKGVATAD